MSSHADLKPIKLYGKGGPNPPKVEIILNELGLPHEVIPVAWDDIKKPAYTAINPNGRVPAIQDPNTGLTLWESGAILEYLVTTYDKDHKISFPAGTPEAWHAKQWLFFQTTGQAPYFGQAAWFVKFHPEKLPSAIDRYVNEIQRVQGVLERVLNEQKEKYAAGTGQTGDGPWLVGNKVSYADIAFVTWQNAIEAILGDKYSDENFPTFREWLTKLRARPAVAEVTGSAGQVKAK